MSGRFFSSSSGIPEPDINLEVGSGTQAEQSAAIMLRYEKLLQEQTSDLCLVVGDVTSTMACAIVARKCGVPVAHVEGGIRSGDWSMPEEINRVVTDAITNWFFTTSETANENLRRAGVTEERIFFVGNTMIDTLLKQSGALAPARVLGRTGLAAGRVFCGDAAPAGERRRRGCNWRACCRRSVMVPAGLPVIFPVHPRTARNAKGSRRHPGVIHYVDPQRYLEFNYLVKHAKGVITDSGGITEETTVMGVPCLTLRDTTERPETVAVGTNELIGTDPARSAPPRAAVCRGVEEGRRSRRSGMAAPVSASSPP